MTYAGPGVLPGWERVRTGLTLVLASAIAWIVLDAMATVSMEVVNIAMKNSRDFDKYLSMQRVLRILYTGARMAAIIVGTIGFSRIATGPARETVGPAVAATVTWAIRAALVALFLMMAVKDFGRALGDRPWPGMDVRRALGILSTLAQVAAIACGAFALHAVRRALIARPAVVVLILAVVLNTLGELVSWLPELVPSIARAFYEDRLYLILVEPIGIAAMILFIVAVAQTNRAVVPHLRAR